MTESGAEAEDRHEDLKALLRRHPAAMVAALDQSGLIVPVPSTIALGGQQVLEGRAMTEWVVAEDRVVMAQAWVRLRTADRVTAAVRLASSPGDWLSLHFFDLFATHGVAFGVIVPETVAGLPVELGLPVPARSRLASYCTDADGVLVSCDDRCARTLGYDPSQLVGMQGLDLVHPEDQPLVIDIWIENIATHRPCTARYRHSSGDGEWMWVDGTMHNYLHQPDRQHVLVELIDVSEAMAAKEALEAREILLERLAQALPVGVLQIDSARTVVYSNQRLHEILGIPVATCDLGLLLAPVDPRDRADLEERLVAAVDGGHDGDVDLGLLLPDGERRRCLVSIRPLPTRNATGDGAILCVSDTTESARLRSELEDRATFDVLTRCLNRASVMAALHQALADPVAPATGVIFIDLDRFKPVNDQHGHAVGDELLVAIARRLQGCLREGDALGRIGGDEFLVVCHDIGTSGELLGVAERMERALASPVSIGELTIEVAASMGLAFSQPRETADAMVAVADDAMYRAKRLGGGRSVLGAACPADLVATQASGSAKGSPARGVAVGVEVAAAPDASSAIHAE